MLSNQVLQTPASYARPSATARPVAGLTPTLQQIQWEVRLWPVRPGGIVAAALSCSTQYDRCRLLRSARCGAAEKAAIGRTRLASSKRQTHTQIRAVPVAELGQAGAQAADLLPILGIAFGGVFVALWNVEKQSKQSLEQEVVALKDQLSAAQQQLQEVQQQLAAEQQAREEAESWRGRLDDAQTELFKLEKALEIKDAQLATFMTTAHRQIRSLEDSVKELQKMP